MRKIILAFITCFLFLTNYQILNGQQGDLNSQITKFSQALFYINNYYLDTVNNEMLAEEAVKKIISLLDPHSSYISAKDVKAMNEPLEGNFEGVGIEFAIIRDTLTVAATISGGPSERVGLRGGDKIIAIDNVNIASTGLTNQQVYGYLRGPKGTKVILTIKRKGVDKPLEFEIVRDKIPINSVDAGYEALPGVVYVKLSRFASNSAHEIINTLLELNIGQLKGFILDLRGNSGGFLGTALEISNFFLDAGQTIVYTEGMRINKMTERAKGTGFYRRGPLVVLIDENSASASEIVAGAVQDWDRGTVIGRKTFGKGLVQQMLPLNDGSQLRLTVARYHTPSGRVIQSPYEAGSADKYYKAVLDRYQRGESFNRDSIHFPDSLKYRTLVKGRTVYGGGGIMPDIFIPADTSHYTEYYGNLLRRGIVTDFMNDYSDANRESWRERYKNFESFDKGFVIDNALIEKLVLFAAGKGVAPSPEQLEISKREIEHFIKALAARSLFGTNGYFRVINTSSDPIYEKALEVISSRL